MNTTLYEYSMNVFDSVMLLRIFKETCSPRRARTAKASSSMSQHQSPQFQVNKIHTRLQPKSAHDKFESGLLTLLLQWCTSMHWYPVFSRQEIAIFMLWDADVLTCLHYIWLAKPSFLSQTMFRTFTFNVHQKFPQN